MKNFRDSEGREWTIGVTIGSASRVKQLLGLDLLAPLEGEPPLVTRLNLEVYTLVDVIFALVKPQADQRGLSDLEFAEGLAGEASWAAYTAFMEDWRDFFQKRQQPDVVLALDKNLALVRRAVELTERIVEAAAARIERTITSRAEDGLGRMSGEEPGRLESTRPG